ncbi:hypothetical protein [Enterococcus casseliflavus]|nr:hypothetical protein [Enterococcus casseliflavus]
MGGEKKKAFAVEFFGENQQMAIRRYYTYISFLYYINNWIGDKEK